jgi:hypothetical protein
MAWTAPTTQTTGTLVTAAIWNRDVTDNLTFLGVSHDHSGDAGDGATLTSYKIPAGMILPFDAACPSGWTRVSAWDGKFVRGSATYDAVGGGADTHLHTGPSHTHTTPDHTHDGVSHTHTGPSHTHDQNSNASQLIDAINIYRPITASGVSGDIMYWSSGAGALSRTKMGAGAAAGGTGATGAANAATASASGTTNSGGTGNTDSISTLPEYISVIFCKKD